MEDNIEDLKQQIDSCIRSGGISDSDIQKLKASAQNMGVPPGEFNSLVSKRLGIEAADIGFQPKWYHLVLAVLVIAAMSLFVFVTINFDSDGDNIADEAPASLRSMPVSAGDLTRIFSGNYDGKSVLITIKSAQETSPGICTVVFDVKIDFVPVAVGAQGVFDLGKRTFDLGANEQITRKVPIDKGTMERTISGKLVLRPDSGKLELVQL